MEAIAIEFENRDLWNRLAAMTGLYASKRLDGAVEVDIAGWKWYAHPGQLRLIDAFFEGNRMVQAVCGARWGKTRLAAQLAAWGFLQNHKNMWIVAPTYSLGKKTFQYVLEILDKIPWIAGEYEVNRSTMSIRSKDRKWGSMIMLKSAKHEYSLDAEELDMVIPDEFAKCTDRIWNRLRPRLMDRQGQAFAISTPIGHNHFFDMYESDRWYSTQSTSYENPFLPAGEIDELKKDMDALAFKQEIEASFVVFTGLVYFMFSPETHIVDPKDVDLTGWSTTVVVDPGLNDPCAITWFKHNKVTGNDIIIRSIRQSNMLFPEVLQIIRRYEPPEGYDGYVYDPWGGDARSQETNHSFRSWMRDNGGIVFRARRIGKRERILAARGRFMNVDGEIKLKLLNVPENKSIIRAVENYHYPENEHRQTDPVHDVSSHECDNIANYVAWRHMSVKTRSRSA